MANQLLKSKTPRTMFLETADAEILAARITADLFTNGAGREAERLVLTSKQGEDLGGWRRIVVRCLIERILNGERPLT